MKPPVETFVWGIKSEAAEVAGGGLSFGKVTNTAPRPQSAVAHAPPIKPPT
jgi:hypothetical protein